MSEQNTNSTAAFSEYVRFEPVDAAGKDQREQQYEEFIGGHVTSPDMQYPKLDGLDYKGLVEAYDDVIANCADDAEKARLIARRAGVEIAEASRRHNDAGKAIPPNHEDRFILGRSIVSASESRYGELDKSLFLPILVHKRRLVEDFEPGNFHAELLKKRVEALLPDTDLESQHMLVDDELIGSIKGQSLAHLQPILESVPEEGVFGPEEVRQIAEDVLSNTGLAEKGWKAVVVETAGLFSTARSPKLLKIPGVKNTDGSLKTWSARDIKRLMAHEVGAHAMLEGYISPDMEEGLGLLFEVVVTGIENDVSIKRAQDRYFALGLASGFDGIGRNARQVFEILWRTEAISLSTDGIIPADVEDVAKQRSKTLIENIFRGTDHKLPGVYYNKAKAYLEGLKEMIEYAKANCDREDWIKELLQKGTVK